MISVRHTEPCVMVVPLVRIFAQQPPIAAVIPFLESSTSVEAQLSVLQALESVDDRYREEILRHLVKIVERNGSDAEVAEEVWEAYYLLKSPAAIARLREAGDSCVRYDLPNSKHVVIHEDRSTLIQGGGTGHRTWESSLALTEFLCVHEELRGFDSAIELGTGTGLVGMTLAQLGAARHVHLTDGSPHLIAKLNETIKENGLEARAEASVLLWEDTAEAAKLPKGAIVFAGDVLYGLPSLFHVVLDCIAELKPSRVFLANPVRNPEAYAEFKKLCQSQNIGVRVVASYTAASPEESEWMFLVSIPPIPVEIIELEL